MLRSLTCPYCQELVREAVTFPCGCTLCAECAVDSVNEHNGCSFCQQPFHSRDASEDFALRQLVALTGELRSVLQRIGTERARQLEVRAQLAALPAPAAAAHPRASKVARIADPAEPSAAGASSSSSSSRRAGGGASASTVASSGQGQGEAAAVAGAGAGAGGGCSPRVPPVGALRLAAGCPIVLCGTGLSEESRRLLRRARALLGGAGGAAEVVDDFDAATVTHVVTQCGAASRVCKRTLKFAQGLLCGCWIVSAEWLGAVVRAGGHVEEAPFEVQGITQLPTCGAPARARAAAARGAPPLFDGLTFRLMDPLPRSLSREDAALLLRAGGGAVAAEPALAPLPPTTAGSPCPTFGIVSMAPEDWEGAAGRGRDMQGLRKACASMRLLVLDQLWILDSITAGALCHMDDYSWDNVARCGRAQGAAQKGEGRGAAKR